MNQLLSKITPFLSGFALLALLVFSGCGDSGKKNGNDGVDTTSTNNKPVDSNDEATRSTLYSAPSPIQMAFYLLNTEAAYNSELLNPYTKAEDYSNSFTQAINLGIYQADLGYIIAHHQTQDAINYFESVKKLGDKLGVFGNSADNMIERAEKNLDKKDSLFSITTNAFKNAEVYLNENARPDVADLIAIGGWIESTYLATQTLKTQGSAQLRKRIGDDKLVLPKLLKLVKGHKAEGEMNKLIADLEDLNSVYQSIKIKREYKPAETNKEKKVTVITSSHKVRYSKDQLSQITEKVAAIRNRYTQ